MSSALAAAEVGGEALRGQLGRLEALLDEVRGGLREPVKWMQRCN